ncbi:DUF4190 domain-containing protein [Streptomyces sp. col6]|uniref:DUF4190 domain-containing protein n=1 Tax=Streptomyces sp. col6 TaxID=2478958 RepID=UPI00399029A8
MPPDTAEPEDARPSGDPVSLDKGAGPDGPRPPQDAAPAGARPGPDRPTGDGIPGGPHTPTATAPGGPRPPGVHDQMTVASMPGVGTGPVPANPFAAPQPGATGFAGPPTGGPGWSAPGSVPPPPVGPNGPGQGVPQMGPGGYPGSQPPPAASYGYPAGQPAQFGYPGYPGYGHPWGGPQPANGMGIAALVLGLISVVGFCMYGLGIVLGVLALIFGVLGRGRAQRGEADNGGVALAGIILGSVGIVVSAAFLGFLIWAITSDDTDDDSGSAYERAAVSQIVEAREHAPLGHISVRA